MAVAVACPGSASARGGSCTSSACTAEMTVGAMTVRWSTPEAFYPSEQRFNVRLTVGDEQLKVVRRFGGCETRYAAPGIKATVRACAEGAPIVLYAHRIWGGTVSLKMTYRAVAPNIPQQVKGIHAGSGQPEGSGGIGPKSG